MKDGRGEDEEKASEDEKLRVEAAAVIDQARWLQELHSKRDEAAQTRAVAAIGLGGVLLTIASKSPPQHPAGWLGLIWVVALGVAGFTVIMGVCAAWPLTTGAPATEGLRKRWRGFRQNEGVAPTPQIAEDLTRSANLDLESVMDLTKSVANRRSCRLRITYCALAVGILALGVETVVSTIVSGGLHG